MNRLYKVNEPNILESHKMTIQAKKQHVLMFPFMAQSHFIPFIALALQIQSKKDYHITFINTPLNIPKLRSLLPPTSSIRLRSVPFDAASHGLPPGVENTNGLPFPLITRLVQSSFSLEPHLRTLLAEMAQDEEAVDAEGNRVPYPVAIITDYFFPWAGRVAHEFNIFHAIFSFGAFGLACYYSLSSNLSHWMVQVQEGSSEIDMEDFPEGGKIHVTQMPSSMTMADGKDAWSVFQKKITPEWFNADGLLFNTAEELDRVGLDYFRRKFRVPVWAIGPILYQNRGERDDAGEEECKAWLDTKPPRSVLYISFGTQSALSSSQMEAMATALEDSGRLFIWVARPPVDNSSSSYFGSGFEAFERKVHGRSGLVLRKWAPQELILSHGSTGGFVSQCGWNSVVEAVINEVPIIGWPMMGEQCFTVKLLEEELGVCVELARGGAQEVKNEEIRRKIEMVMGEGEGAAEIRRRVRKAKEMIEDANLEGGPSVRAMDEFFSTAIARVEDANSL